MADLLSNISDKVVNFVVDQAAREVGYLIFYKCNFKEFQNKAKDLQNARGRVQHKIDHAKKNAQEIEADVVDWLNKVDMAISENDKFLGDQDHNNTGCNCTNGSFPNLWLMFKLGRKAKKMTQDIEALLLQKDKLEGVSFWLGLGQTWVDTALSTTASYQCFKTRDETIDKIMGAMRDSSVRMVGVYGLGGVGKTTLVKQIARKVQETSLFSVVVMANITRNPDLRRIQGQIADMLGMTLEEESVIGRASHIHKRLKEEEENTLVILDDLWDELDLNLLGIPFDGGGGGGNLSQKNVNLNKQRKPMSDDFIGCKVLLTSRSKQVLCDQIMGVNANANPVFPLEVLKEKEALELFKNVAGLMLAKNKDSSDFDKLASKIASKCGGLPIAIVKVGRELKNKAFSVWEDVHQQLERHSFTGVHNAIEFSTRLSYDQLEDEELKSVILLCARMSHDSLIGELLKYCIGLGIFQGVYTVKEAKDRLQSIIIKLKASSLLLDSHSNDRFTMHDIVRDSILLIASKHHVFFMRNGKIDEWPEANKLVRYNVVSLHYCDIIGELPECLNCPKLKLFHVDSKDPSLKIPDNFFKRMRELKVLILTGFDLSVLPSSIRHLKGLRMLCMEQCIIGDCSIIGELKNLRVFSLSGSFIESLPNELCKLGMLQMFDITNCSKLSVIPPRTISSLNNLEEFYVRNNLVQWDQSENASLSELRHLYQLRTLDVQIPSIDPWPKDLFFDNLENYKIIIGEFDTLSMGDFKLSHQMYEASRVLALQLKEGFNIHSQKGIKMLFKRVESLLLGELNDVCDVLYELNFEGFPSLKHLAIANNTGIQYIHKSTERLHSVEAFPNLESMNLCKIWNMEEIFCCQLSDASFRNLKSIKIETCVRLKNLFSFSIAKFLRELETIEVFDCDSLEKIVSMESQGNSNDDHVKDDKIEFPRLRHLILQSLPAFTSFYTKSRIPLASQSAENQVQNEYQLAPEDNEVGVSSFSLLNEKVSIPKLETLELFSIDHIRKIWCDQSLPSHCFQNLKKLNVTDCSNLKYLLSFSMARNLENLQTLFVSKCEMMEDILSMHDAEMIDIFPKLKKIQITCMEKLKTIWHAELGSTSFQNLETLIIKECHKLVNIFPSYMVGKYQSLQALEVVNCRSMEHIFDLEHVPPSQVTHGRINETRLQYLCLERLAKLKNVWKLGNTKNIIIEFKNLRYLAFDRCFAVETIFPTCVAIVLKKLEYLYVLYCPLMKDIVAMDEEGSQNTITFEFPRLTYLSLQMLLEFRSFYWGMHILEWPALKEFYLFHCYKLEAMNLQVKPIFLAVEKVISNLEVLGISPKEAKWLQDYMGNNYRMQKLRRLCFDGLKSIEILFWFLHRMPNLEALEFIDCRFKEIWPHDDRNLTMHNANIGTIVQLKALELCKLPYLQNIGFEHDLVVQRVESIILQSCPNLVKFVPNSSVSFNHLKHLEVSECDKLMNLMPSSIAKSLVHLTTMKVSECELMEEIIINNDDGGKNSEEIIVFRQLTTLELVCLSSLMCFCSSENCHFMFPSLEKMVVRECPRMKMLSKGVKSTPKLRKVCAEEKRWYWEGDVNATIEKIFSRMDSFEYSKHLILSVHPELEQVWQGQVDLPHNCFRNLKTLIVAHSGYVRDYVIPSHLLYYLKNMEELQVRNCTQVKVIFDINDMGMMTKTKEIASHLRNLRLEKLPNLKSVWKYKNLQGVKFQDLREVDVTSCKSLRSLFPSSLAKNLRQLRSLKIATCDDLVEIVGTEEEEEDDDDVQGGKVTQKFKFPCLTSLTLYYLPQLDCFYRGTHIMNCPSLQNLYVGFCDKLEMFTTKHTSSHQEAYPNDEIGNSTYYRQPLFLVEEVIPKLEKLSLNQKDIMILRDGQFSSDLLHKLDTLRLYFDTNNEVAAKTTSSLLFELLLKAPYIECLVLASAGLNQIIFPASQVDDDAHSRILLLQLKKLVLNSISGLSSIESKDDHTWLSLVLERLQILHIFSCPNLTKLADNSTTFSSLERLIIRRCHKLEYLFTSSTAKSLEHLLSLEIQDCESIKVVVAEEEEVKECCKIIFGWLSLLHLESLPNLERFYLGNNNATLEFSYLEKVVIDKCPKMKTFSQGVTIAPNFYAMQASSDPNDLHLLEDLNATVQMVFCQRVEHLILGDHPELEELWQYGGVAPIQNGCFSNLKSLVVKGCGFLSNSVIPFHLFPFLSNLEELKVAECDSVTSIFDMKGITPINPIFSLRLKKLVFGQLHNLEHVWNNDPKGILSLPFLHQVCVNGCGSITSLFPASVAIDKLEKLEVVQCERLVEIVAKDEEDAEINEGESQEFVFHCLNSLTLWDLPELKCFYPGKHKLEWPKLIELNVYHCAKLKIFQSELQSHHETGLEDQQAIVSIEKVFPNLKQLLLSSEHMMVICDEKFEDSLLHSIKYLRLMCFHNNDHVKETIFPCQILHKVPNIEKLQVGCGDLIKEIFCSQSSINDHHQDHTAILTILSKLKSLVLDSLPNLNSIGFEHSWLHPSSFPKRLETLEVKECSSLMNLLVPSSSKVCFSNLMDLTVASCDGMVHLFTSSIAKTLTLLKNMSIRDCRSMKEIIVANTDEDDDEDEIIMFKNLEALSLHSLTSLECFYSGSLKMEFPLLGKLSILHCSRMKFFCQSENDLNAIIKKNYEKE